MENCHLQFINKDYLTNTGHSETNRIAVVQVVDGDILECTSLFHPPNNARDRLFIVSCPATKQGIVLLFEHYQESNLSQLANILQTHVQGNNVTYVGSDMFCIEVLRIAGIDGKACIIMTNTFDQSDTVFL